MTGGQLDAAVLRPGDDDARIETLLREALRANEVLVRIVGAGVCHTDLSCRTGPFAVPRPVVLGHEGAGIVEEVGAEVRTLAPGDPVVLSFVSCGTCSYCEAGFPSYCDIFFPCNMSGRRVDGSTALGGGVAGHFYGQSSFATHSVVRADSAIKVRSDAPLELLGPLGCGAMTGAGTVMNVLRPSPGNSIAIFGAGGVGLSAVMAAVVEGCGRIIVVEPHASRRALALEVGATDVLDPADGDPGERIAAMTGGVDHAIDTSGLGPVITAAIAGLKARGQLALITASPPTAVLALPLMPILVRGITLRGVAMGDADPQAFIPRLVDLIMAGRFPIEKLVRFYDFADINQAFDDQESGTTVKPILQMGKGNS